MKKNRETIFVTRKLADHSPIWQLKNKGFDIIDISLISIKGISIEKIPTVDIYFYYSKNAVKYFWQKAQKTNIDFTESIHACMGKGTANYLTQTTNIQPDYIGNGNPPDVAKELIMEYGEKSICFVRAQQSTKSVQQLWPKPYQEVVVYTTAIKSEKIGTEVDHLFVTSPLNAESFFKNNNPSKLKSVVCIGKTTANKVSQLYDGKIIIANESSEQSMLSSMLDNINNR